MSDKTAETLGILLGGLITAAIMCVFFAAWWVWDNGLPQLHLPRTRRLAIRVGKRIEAWAKAKDTP